MTKLLTQALVLTIMVLLMGAVGHHETEYSGELTVEESLPLLQTLSKLYHISTVKGSPFGNYRTLPHFCWMIKGEQELDFRRVKRALDKYGGSGDWLIGTEIPRVCIAAQPKERKHMGSLSAAREFRRVIVGEIPALSRFIEEQLNLTEEPSLGVELPPKDISLKGIEDYSEPHFRNFYLVADPEKFSPDEPRLTSGYDRVLHFGLTEEEAFRISQTAKEDKLGGYTVLPRFYEPYKDQFVRPTEIEQLLQECSRLKENASDPVILRGLGKLMSVSKSAGTYNLGIFVDSE